MLSKLHQNPNEEDYDQHRKHLLMRRIQQVLRDDRNQTEEEEEYNQRKPTYDLLKNQSSTTATATTNSSTKNRNRFFSDNLSQKSFFFQFQIELFEVHYYLHRIIEMIEVRQHIKNQQQIQNIQVLAKLLNQFN